MIDKNFYLENLSAFDMLIDVKPEEAKKAIFKVYCIFQRDKIWITEIAQEDEFSLEDVELLEDIETELEDLDKEYGFNFEEFYEKVQQEIRKNQLPSSNEDEDLNTNDFDEVEDDHEDEWEDDLEYTEEEPEDYESDELDAIVETILQSAKKRFDYPLFCSLFTDINPQFIDENLLFAIISEKAHAESTESIAEKIEMEFLENGYSIDAEDLMHIIDKKANELRSEILVFQIAFSSLNQGANPDDVLKQIEHFLNQA